MAEVPPDSGETEDLLRRAHPGEPRAFVELFAGYTAGPCRGCTRSCAPAA